MRDIASPLDGFASPFGVFRFNMQRLFASDTAGIYYNFSDLTSLYTDSAGATPLTLPDTTIGLVADRSRVRSPVTVAAGIQASAGLRPKWGRAPKVRRNLLTYTEQFDNAAWGKSGVTIIANATTDPIGVASADKLVSDAATSFHRVAVAPLALTATSYTLSAYMKAAEYTSGGLSMFNGTTFAARATFDLVAGIVSISDGTATITSVGNGWYRCTVTGLGNATITSYVSANSVFTFAGTAGNGIYVWGAQLELGASATAYQKVTNAFDMTEDGLASYGFTRPDRSDDVLATTIPADQTGDVAIFGRNGSWIENAKTYAAASTFSLGATTATGLASGVLAAVGDIVGVLAIGKALSDAEKLLALDYHKARGAAGWLVAGAEAEPNGAFASGTGWTPLAGWAISGGAANATATSASLTSTTTLTAGRLYLVTFDWTHTSGTLFVRVGAGAAATFTSSGAKRMILQTTSVAGVEFYGGGVTGVLDNVSVKLLTVAA